MFSWVVKIRSGFGYKVWSQANRNYGESVVGGVLELSPRNIPGRFFVPATSHLAKRVAIRGEYEPEVTAALMKLPKSNGAFVNVGANVGFFSVFAANQLGFEKVVAIEPNPDAFELLVRNLRNNGLSERVSAHRVCVARIGGEVEFATIEGKPEFSSIGGIVHPSVKHEQTKTIMVAAVPLDEILGDTPVSILFVDTEGAEEEVFSGAEEILVRDKPVLFFECSDLMLQKFGSSSESLERKLTGLGYRVRNGLAPSLKLRHPYEGEAVAYFDDAGS